VVKIGGHKVDGCLGEVAFGTREANGNVVIFNLKAAVRLADPKQGGHNPSPVRGHENGLFPDGGQEWSEYREERGGVRYGAQVLKAMVGGEEDFGCVRHNTTAAVAPLMVPVVSAPPLAMPVVSAPQLRRAVLENYTAGRGMLSAGGGAGLGTNAHVVWCSRHPLVRGTKSLTPPQVLDSGTNINPKELAQEALDKDNGGVR
jgi:hypothetical protein